jgi:hypothetical protein
MGSGAHAEPVLGGKSMHMLVLASFTIAYLPLQRTTQSTARLGRHAADSYNQTAATWFTYLDQIEHLCPLMR